MAQHIILGAVSTSSSVIDKKELGGDSHFKWDSIRNFLYLAEAFSSVHVVYDIFTGLTTDVPIYIFILFAIVVGMPYMCMEFFIKQYSGKIDFNESLNPLLKGINYGILCVSAFYTLIHANDLADSVIFLILTVTRVPQWSDCSNMKRSTFKDCIPTHNITLLCAKQKTSLTILSSHINYHFLFLSTDRSTITSKIFIIAIVWIINFFISTISDQVLVKFFYLSFMLRNISTIIATIFVIFSAKDYLNPALRDVMALKFSKTSVNSVTAPPVLYVFGIGIVGVYDFGTMSPYTTVDNAVVIFTIFFILLAFLRALLVRILHHVVNKCLKINQFDYHYFLFGLMPLSADFLFSQRLFTMYLYINLTLGLCTHLAAVTAALTKLFHSEFRTIKGMYIAGLLCFLGFILSAPLGMYHVYHKGYLLGLNNAMLLMSFLKTTIIMYLYGVQKFSTDVHFWLNYKPTKYWTLTWALMPVFFGGFVACRMVEIANSANVTSNVTLTALIVTLNIAVFMLLIQIRTVVKFIASNNLTGLFRSSNRYGPPDGDERKLRRRYDEALSVRHCTHNCVLLDVRIFTSNSKSVLYYIILRQEFFILFAIATSFLPAYPTAKQQCLHFCVQDRFDCNHMPLTFKPVVEEEEEDDLRTPGASMMHIFEAGPVRKSRQSELLDVQQMQD